VAILQFSHFDSENEEYYYKLLRGDSEDELNAGKLFAEGN
jgi:hypothetical protein